jgi:pimeloyl-ACP methyl ester carboxylesterase
MLTGLNGSVRVYALDLLGSGWSDKPFREDHNARLVNGENGRFVNCDSMCYRESQSQPSETKRLQKIRTDATMKNVPLGTSVGGNRVASELDLRHPLNSPYNFYTWAEQLTDFVHDVIHVDDNKPVTLVANSIGTMSSLQSAIDEPNLFNGVVVINPNFRELHMAEVPFSKLTMPLVRQIQSLLRNKGHGLFKSLATPQTVTEILKEPYAVTEAIDEELVSVLLDPLLTPGADEVVFDTLSYSAGPLPEQQLSSPDFPNLPVWVIYGKDDPWTPAQRVEKLIEVGRPGEMAGTVERVVGLEGVGHCPHDERPEVVNGLVMEFLERLKQ